jgi:hypothetical protein
MRTDYKRWVLSLAVLSLLLAAPAVQADVPYDVDIVFMGLITYVPGTATVTVIVPNLKGGLDNVGDDGHDVDGHFPYILAAKKTMPPDDVMNKKLDFYRANNDGETYHYLLLQGDEIAVDASNNLAGNNTALAYTTNGGSPCPVKDEANPANDSTKSLYWLSSITKANGGSGLTPDAAHFSATPDRAVIAARAVLNYGSLEAHVIKPGVIWDFVDPKNLTPTGLAQALAQEVHWKFQATGDPFILDLFSFDSNGRRVAFKKPQVGEPLIIIVGNTMQNDTGALSAPGKPALDPHYSAYYQFISGNAVALGPIPYPRDEGAPPARCAHYWLPTLQPGGPVLDTVKTVVLNPMPNRKKKTAKAPAAMMVMPAKPGGQPTPNGLNCSGSIWP